MCCMGSTTGGHRPLTGGRTAAHHRHHQSDCDENGKHKSCSITRESCWREALEVTDFRCTASCLPKPAAGSRQGSYEAAQMGHHDEPHHSVGARPCSTATELAELALPTRATELAELALPTRVQPLDSTPGWHCWLATQRSCLNRACMARTGGPRARFASIHNASITAPLLGRVGYFPRPNCKRIRNVFSQRP